MARHAGQDRPQTSDLESLEAFAALGDRESTPFFAGRDREIATIDALCDRALARARAGAGMQGATQLIQGAPGAGKTALLSEMARRWALGKTPQDTAAPVAVQVYVGELANEAIVAARIAEAIDPKAGEAWRISETRDMSGRAGIPGIVSAGGARQTATAPPVPSFHELRRRFPPSSWTRAVCLTVDEVQNVEPAARSVLDMLHQGMPGLPVVPVLAGLGNSQDVIATREVGLSRLGIDAIHDLGALAPEEAGQAVEAMLERCHVDRNGAGEDWPRLLAERSDCWPQHLHNGMRALAGELVRTEGRLADVRARIVLERETAYRERAYRARISPQMERSRRLVAALFTALPEEGLFSGQTHREIERLRQPDTTDPEQTLPEGMRAWQFFEHLVHRGALQRRQDDRFVCPIPSFRRFLIDYGADDNGAGVAEPPRP